MRELERWPEKVLTMQRNWVGRSEGARVRFRDRRGGPSILEPPTRSVDIEVFTTRIDTIYGANFIVLAPEHPLVAAVRRGPPPIRRRFAPRSRSSPRRTGRLA